MSAIKLDDLRKGADAKYPDFEIEAENGKILGFKPTFRLPKKARRAIADAMDLKKRLEELQKDDEAAADTDQPAFLIAVLQDAFRLSERTRGDYTALAKWAGSEDLGMWLFLFEQYTEVTDAGEASPSES